MEDYGKLIEDFQCGDINALEFLLAQKELAPVYVADMRKKELLHLWIMQKHGYVSMKMIIYISRLWVILLVIRLCNSLQNLMVKKIEEVSDNYKNPWFSSIGHGLPQNLEGRVYNGINSFMLFLLQEKNHYQTPVYMTFLQAKDQGIRINKGAAAFPVLYWNFQIKDDEGKKISMDEYKALGKEEQQKYTVYPYTKVYPVFNVDQTNYSEVYPEKWKELQQKFNVAELKDEQGMFCSQELDNMLRNEKWLCPIILNYSDSAFFRPSEDKIYLPLKGQFKTGESFYATLLHEMAHSNRYGRAFRQGVEKCFWGC